MPWFKVDDNLAFHAKVLAAGNDAMGLWVRAGSWCAQQLTDGIVPTHVIASLGTSKQARRLVEAGLWETHRQGFAFHDWAERQPSRDEVESKREAARERMAQVRAARSQNVRANTSRTEDARSREVRLTPTRPDPTRPSVLPEQREQPPTSSALVQPPADDGFDKFWAVYPRRQGKADAKKAWGQRKCSKVAANVIAGAARYRDDPNREDAFTKMPAGWLREGRWDDDPLPARGGSRIDTEERARQARRNRWMAEAQAEQHLALVAAPEPKEVDPWTA